MGWGGVGWGENLFGMILTRGPPLYTITPPTISDCYCRMGYFVGPVVYLWARPIKCRELYVP